MFFLNIPEYSRASALSVMDSSSNIYFVLSSNGRLQTSWSPTVILLLAVLVDLDVVFRFIILI